jgi:hypothetical protein
MDREKRTEVELRLIAEAGVCVVSYPKSGRTWLRVLIGGALCKQYGLDDQLIFDRVQLTEAAGLPPIHYTHDFAPRRHYQDLSRDKTLYSSTRVILLVRDPRDVVVSAYFQNTARTRRFAGSLSAFIRDDQFGIRKIVTFYNNWHASRHVPRDFFLLRYEALRTDTAHQLRQVLSFLRSGEMDEAVIAEAVEYASFANMRQMEEQGHFRNRAMRPTTASDTASFKVRRGVIGGYRDALSLDDCAYIDGVIQEVGCPFYPLQPPTDDGRAVAYEALDR